jgi:GNAT superfamily N-acetyltransferase
LEPDDPGLAPFQAGQGTDWTAVMGLLHRAFAAMDGRIDPPSSLHRLTAEGVARQAETGEVWLIGTPPVACLFLTRLPQALYLGKLAVDPQVQGRGLARRLLEVAEGRARALGLPAIELQARVELTENHATFRALGFTETGRTAHHGFDRPTAVSFRKTL